MSPKRLEIPYTAEYSRGVFGTGIRTIITYHTGNHRHFHSEYPPSWSPAVGHGSYGNVISCAAEMVTGGGVLRRLGSPAGLPAFGAYPKTEVTANI